MMVQEMLDAVVVQSDSVEHSASGLDGSRRTIAGAWMARHGLGHDAAQAGKVHDPGHFARIAERARSCENQVFQLQTAKRNGEIDHPAYSITPAGKEIHG